ncbi:MAG: hypothetical protein AB7R89_08300 [Dehalococcoidia bacterium]
MQRASIESTLSWQQAVDQAAVGVFAFRDERGRPLAWPVTPYRDGTHVVITSTLAYLRKAEHVHRDGRVALLAGGAHLTGRARVREDIAGRRFAARLLAQEERKYPPTRRLTRMPFHRLTYWWYFGRALIGFVPETVTADAGSDKVTLITLDRGDMPRITPIALALPADSEFALPGSTDVSDGPAAILFHQEDRAMEDLRFLLLRGTVRDGRFTFRSRIGSLDPPAAPTGDRWSRLRDQAATHRRAFEAARTMRRWQTTSPAIASPVTR